MLSAIQQALTLAVLRKRPGFIALTKRQARCHSDR